ncbi:MAG TPA: hypothetical protein VGL56_13435 [Fimbriimonadaceae bacterium]|jgi:hypothetical protein
MRMIVVVEHVFDVVIPTMKVNDEVDRFSWHELLWDEDSDR